VGDHTLKYRLTNKTKPHTHHRGVGFGKKKKECKLSLPQGKQHVFGDITSIEGGLERWFLSWGENQNNDCVCTKPVPGKGGGGNKKT